MSNPYEVEREDLTPYNPQGFWEQSVAEYFQSQKDESSNSQKIAN